MWATVLPLIVKYGLPILISALQKTGFAKTAETMALKFGAVLVKDAEGLKEYPGFPTDKNGQ